MGKSVAGPAAPALPRHTSRVSMNPGLFLPVKAELEITGESLGGREKAKKGKTRESLCL